MPNGMMRLPGGMLPRKNRPEERAAAPEVQAAVLTGKAKKPIGKEEIRKAAELLQKYKQGKTNLESRIVEDELWWELRHWEVIGRSERCPIHPGEHAEPASAWLFNAILNKHADAMDNIPAAVVLPREESDKESAKLLGEVLPVIMEAREFEQTYSDNWWEKLKHGTAVYGVFWDNGLENGLGDVDVRGIDLLKIFWEPGITDIQDSRNLFIVDLADEEELKRKYPQLKDGKLGNVIDVKKYVFDDQVDTSDKVLVVDWYYKKTSLSGRQVLHYVKFAGEELIYASENEEEYAEKGWYEDGAYPVVFDTMFPEKGTPVGFGYVSVCKEPQIYIDKLFGNLLEYANRATKPRTFASMNAGINEAEYLDWSKPIIHVEGSVSGEKLQQLVMPALPGIYANLVQMKIEELKETAANRDVSNGGGSGAMAAAAIAALQEAGNKASRDMIAASYRAHTRIVAQVIERLRQFYDEKRSFRIVGPGGEELQFVDFSNAGLRERPVGVDAGGLPLYRVPVFDLKVKAQKKNPFSVMEQNERAKELYIGGFFAPERAQEAMGALEMMDFEGIEDVRKYVSQGQTLMSVVQQLQGQVQQLLAVMGAQPAQPEPGRGGGAPRRSAAHPGRSMAQERVDAATPQSGYTQRIVARSKPNMAIPANDANPAK